MRVLLSSIAFALVLVLVVAARSTQAAPSNNNVFDTSKIPNGDRVFVNGHFWPSAFNKTWRGMTDDLNSFGTAFAAAGHTWTTALCNADSDGDGFTNGEELGDPSCLWTTSSSSPPSGFRSVNISHPGLWSSVPMEAYPQRTQTAASSCQRDVAPPSAATERATGRGRASAFALPSGWFGVDKANQFVQEFKPGPDSDEDWGPTHACPHAQSGLVDWHSASTWPGNKVPTAETDVMLPDNAKVLISSCSIPAAGFKKITVPATSQLIFAPGPINLRVKDLIVLGELWIGSAHCPIEAPLTVTFIGLKSEKETYTNGIVANTAGKLEIHGTHQDWTWTRLRATAVRGTRYIVVQAEVGWGVGEDLVITTSIWKDNYENQNEVRRIAAVHPTNKSVYMLDAPLQFDHYGGAEYQSEVGLLWRSILFRGDTTGHEDQYGGHIMANAGTTSIKVSGARGERMGQRNVLARYPFHIHLHKERGNESYIQQIACVTSYFRCAVIHGTNHSLIRKSVSYNSTAHTYYLEDGAEMYNRIEYNLAAHIQTVGKPAKGASQGGEEFEQTDDVLQPADHTASGFYVPNPHNALVGNAASGGWGGFAYPIFDSTLKTSLDITIVPKQWPVLKFEGNTAHSSGYYWGDAGCVYFGGKLWMKDGKLKYTNGRHVHPTMKDSNGQKQYHNISHLKTWLCQMGYSSWGNYVEMDQYEAHDIARSTVMFGESSLQNALVEGNTRNKANDMLYTGRQGFQFYDVSVKTSLYNTTFKNYWLKRQEDGMNNGWGRTGVITDLTHSDIFKPWGISATKALKFQTLDRDILFSRWIRQSGASRMWNVVDWDGSIVNSDSCSAWIIGAQDDWWNAADGSCWFNSVWKAWICRRVPGREVVGLDMELPNLMVPSGSRELDLMVDSKNNYNYNTENYNKLDMGYMTQFGTDGEKRKLWITRNHHLASGLSGQGWYMWSKWGFPNQQLTITPRNFPHGVWILLAMGFPAGTSFEIYSENRWGNKWRLHFQQVSSRDAVAAGNGTQYHFDGKNLYLLITDMWSNPKSNFYTRNDVYIYDAMNSAKIYVTPTCTNTTTDSKSGKTFCHPVDFKAPPKLSSFPNRTCASEATWLFPQNPIDECKGIPNVLPSGASQANCQEYYSSWSCYGRNNASGLKGCYATCGTCRRFNPFPVECSWTKECDTAHRPEAVKDWCSDVMNSDPLSDACRVARCDPHTGSMKHMNLPDDTPCELQQQAGFGVCTDGKCVPSVSSPPSEADVNILNGRGVPGDTAVEIQLSKALIAKTVTAVTATCDRLHHSFLTGGSPQQLTFSLTSKDGKGWFNGQPESGKHCARNMTFTIATSTNGTHTSTIGDWRRTSGRVPSITVNSVSETAAVLTIEPADWIRKMHLAFSSGVKSNAPTYMGGNNRWKFTLPEQQAFSQLSEPQLEIEFSPGHSMNRTLPCLRPSSQYSSCKTDTTNLLEPQTTCNFKVVREYDKTSNWFQVNVNNVPAHRSVVSVTLVAGKSDGSDASIPKRTYGWAGGSSLTNDKWQIVKVMLNDSSTPEFYKLKADWPKKGGLLACVNGTKIPYFGFEPFKGVDGYCDSKYACVPGTAPPTPAPTTTTTTSTTTTTTSAPTTTQIPSTAAVTTTTTEAETTTTQVVATTTSAQQTLSTTTLSEVTSGTTTEAPSAVETTTTTTSVPSSTSEMATTTSAPSSLTGEVTTATTPTSSELVTTSTATGGSEGRSTSTVTFTTTTTIPSMVSTTSTTSPDGAITSLMTTTDAVATQTQQQTTRMKDDTPTTIVPDATGTTLETKGTTSEVKTEPVATTTTSNGEVTSTLAPPTTQNQVEPSSSTPTSTLQKEKTSTPISTVATTDASITTTSDLAKRPQRVTITLQGSFFGKFINDVNKKVLLEEALKKDLAKLFSVQDKENDITVHSMKVGSLVADVTIVSTTDVDATLKNTQQQQGGGSTPTTTTTAWTETNSLYKTESNGEDAILSGYQMQGAAGGGGSTPNAAADERTCVACIVGGVVGAILVVGLVVGGAIFMNKRREGSSSGNRSAASFEQRDTLAGVSASFLNDGHQNDEDLARYMDEPQQPRQEAAVQQQQQESRPLRLPEDDEDDIPLPPASGDDSIAADDLNLLPPMPGNLQDEDDIPMPPPLPPQPEEVQRSRGYSQLGLGYDDI